MLPLWPTKRNFPSPSHLFQLACLVSSLLVLHACDSGVEAEIEELEVRVDPASGEIAVGQELDLAVIIEDEVGSQVERPITWSTSHPSVATVSGGRVRGLSQGFANITAAVGDFSDTARVSVVEPLGLVLPISGVLDETFFMTNHFDHAAASAGSSSSPSQYLEDFQCGGRTVDGARYTLFQLLNRQSLDRGFKVLAAAPGTVEQVVVGSPGDPGVDDVWGTEVTVGHHGGFSTRYGSLDPESIVVGEGDALEAGAVLGEPSGASRWSSYPALFFGVIRPNRSTTDPFTGECGPGFSHWATQPAYGSDLRVLRSRTFGGRFESREAWYEPPPAADTLAPADEWVTFWTDLLYLEPGTLGFRLESSDGGVVMDTTYEDPSGCGRCTWASWYRLAAFPSAGTYTTSLTLDGTEIEKIEFYYTGPAEEGAAFSARARPGLGMRTATPRP